MPESEDVQHAYLVFAPAGAYGTTHVMAFGPKDLDAARATAAAIGGLLVQAPVIADCQEV